MDRVAVRVLRGDVVESVHRASVAVSDARGRLVASFGEPRLVAFLRSAAKPFQGVPLVESGAVDRFKFTSEELAVACSSHSGEERHTRLVAALLDRIGLDRSHLQCGAHAPYHGPTAERLGKNFNQLHENCSGKHAGMLAVCAHKGWDPATYLDAEHPLQREIRNVMASETGLDAAEIGLGVDGCGAPNFAVPLRSAARAYARLAGAQAVRGDRGRTLRRIRDAMLAHPEIIGGTDRLDTDFMKSFPGRLLVKTGAEACYGAGLVDSGWGLVLKIEDGNGRAVGPVLMRVLEELGVATAREKAALERHWNEPVRNMVGRPVGRFECDLRLRRARRAAPRALA